MENGTVVLVQKTMGKTGIATHYYRYGGSCTNKHDKLMDTSIQVLGKVIILNFMY